MQTVSYDITHTWEGKLTETRIWGYVQFTLWIAGGIALQNHCKVERFGLIQVPNFSTVLGGHFGTGKQTNPKYCLQKNTSHLQTAICVYNFVDIRTAAVSQTFNLNSL